MFYLVKRSYKSTIFSNTRKLTLELSKEDLLPHENDSYVQKFLNKDHITAASISENLIDLSIRQQGLKTAFQDLQKWEEDKLPQQAKKTKGGLNKAYIPTPEVLENQDLLDISGAYTEAMKNFKLPLGIPSVIGSIASTTTILAEIVDSDHVLHGIFNLSFSLPEDTNEWLRPLVIYDAKYDISFTGTETGNDQWFTVDEIQTLATLHPHCKIQILSGYIWDKDNTKNSLSLAGLYTSLQTLRQKYKTHGSSGHAMQNTIKLISNAGYGKTLQNKEVWNANELHDHILNGKNISPDLSTVLCTSKIYSSIWGNGITAQVRCTIALTAWKNKAAMAVTDSIVCDTGTFVESKDIITPFKKLNKILQSFKWEKEVSNATLNIFKERDYYLYTVKNGNNNTYITQEIKNGTANEEITKQIEIHKAAKRGFKSNFKDNNERNEDFVRNSFHRQSGEPLIYNEKKLVKFKDSIMKDLRLNSDINTLKKIGSENLRYLCNSIEELNLRTKIKEKCRKHKYADSLDCQIKDNSLYQKIKANTKSFQSQARFKCPPILRNCFFWLIKNNISFRQLSDFKKLNNFPIGKSTLHRWFNFYKNNQPCISEYNNVELLLEEKENFKNLNIEKVFKNSKNHPLDIIKQYILKERQVLKWNSNYYTNKLLTNLNFS